MRRTRIKVCGITDERTLEACAEAGVDAVGFVLAPSPRQVTPERAAELAGFASRLGEMWRVLVFREVDEAMLARVVKRGTVDLVQGDAVSVASTDMARYGVAGLAVYRDGDIEGLMSGVEQPGERAILIEGAQSGAGVRADWTAAAAVAVRRRVLLAGGLTPENVGAAIERVSPFGVDVSSGVESSRGVKDVGRIRAFVAAVREADGGGGEEAPGTGH